MSGDICIMLRFADMVELQYGLHGFFDCDIYLLYLTLSLISRVLCINILQCNAKLVTLVVKDVLPLCPVSSLTG